MVAQINLICLSVPYWSLSSIMVQDCSSSPLFSVLFERVSMLASRVNISCSSLSHRSAISSTWKVSSLQHMILSRFQSIHLVRISSEIFLNLFSMSARKSSSAWLKFAAASEDGAAVVIADDCGLDWLLTDMMNEKLKDSVRPRRWCAVCIEMLLVDCPALCCLGVHKINLDLKIVVGEELPRV